MPHPQKSPVISSRSEGVVALRAALIEEVGNLLCRVSPRDPAGVRFSLCDPDDRRAGRVFLAGLARHADRSSAGAAELSWLTNRYQSTIPTSLTWAFIER